MPIAGSCGISSVCLPIRLVLRGRWRSHLVRHLVRAGCVAMLCLPIVSSLASFVVLSVGSSRRSVRFCVSLAPSCDTIGGEEGGCGVLAIRSAFRFLPACFVPCACLPLVVSRHPSDTDGGGGLRSIGSACSACLPRCIRAASCRSVVPFHGSFDWCGSVPLP